MRNSKILKKTIPTLLGLVLVLQVQGALAKAKEGGSEGSGLTTKVTLADINLPKGHDDIGTKDAGEPASAMSDDGVDGSGSISSDPPAEM